MAPNNTQTSKRTTRRSARHTTRSNTNSRPGPMGKMGSQQGVTRGRYTAHINYIGMPVANEGLLRRLGYFNHDTAPIQATVYDIAGEIFQKDKRARDLRTEKDVVNAIRKNETKALKDYLMRKVGGDLTAFFLNTRRFNKREYRQHGSLRPDRLAELRNSLDAHASNTLPLESRSPTPIKGEPSPSPEHMQQAKNEISDDGHEISENPEPFQAHAPPPPIMQEQPALPHQPYPMPLYNVHPMGMYQPQYHYPAPQYYGYGAMYQPPMMGYGQYAWQYAYTQPLLPQMQQQYPYYGGNEMGLGYGGFGDVGGGAGGYDGGMTQAWVEEQAEIAGMEYGVVGEGEMEVEGEEGEEGMELGIAFGEEA